MPVPPVAHLPFGHDGAARRGESHAFRVELLSDPKGGVALRGYFLGVVTEHVVLTTSNEASSGSCPGRMSMARRILPRHGGLGFPRSLTHAQKH